MKSCKKITDFFSVKTETASKPSLEEAQATEQPVVKYEIVDVNFEDDGRASPVYKKVVNKKIKPKRKDKSKRQRNRKLPKSFNHSVSIADREMGDENEKSFHKKLNRWCGIKFKEDKKGWRVLDYMNSANKIAVELKSRRNRKSQFPTTIIGYNKYQTARRYMMRGWKVFFFFKFTDGIYFWEVQPHLPAGFYKSVAGTNRRGCDEYKDHLYIPVDALRKMRNYRNYLQYLNTV
tara:strand:+ start:505 stop:1206 length:702 start_codon:yes stop_codon:yes gene_type:complete